QNLHKQFGEHHAVQGISFTISCGQVLGFIGANGAGKTTTMRLMATLDTPTEGSINVCGFDVIQFPRQVRDKIGWMPDSYGRYALTTVADYLDFYTRAYGYRRAERMARLEDVMAFTDLALLARQDLDTLSKGQAQRVCLARMLLHDPEVLIMDEPAAGLDPKARVEFKHLVRLLAADGKAIFISSHILSELEDMCDTILFIDQGKIAHHGSTEVLKRQDDTTTTVHIKVAADPERLREWIELSPDITRIESTTHGCRASLTSALPGDVAAILRRMIQDGLPVVDFHQEEQKLEDAFIAMLEKLETSS
ncbi:MAG: ABC transporter ATP-binding protein, partial [Candidatus Entotheonella gemina]